MSYAKVDELRTFVNSLDGYISTSGTLGMTDASTYLTELKAEGEGFLDIITQISNPLPSGVPVTPHCATRLTETVETMNGGPRGLFILELQQNFESNRQLFAVERADDWNELTADQREICLLTAAIRAWAAKTKKWVESVPPSRG
jgi:hypothetical protein